MYVPIGQSCGCVADAVFCAQKEPDDKRENLATRRSFQKNHHLSGTQHRYSAMIGRFEKSNGRAGMEPEQ
jgi:hypothetical protein